MEDSPSPVYGAALLMRFGSDPIRGSNPRSSAQLCSRAFGPLPGSLCLPGGTTPRSPPRRALPANQAVGGLGRWLTSRRGGLCPQTERLGSGMAGFYLDLGAGFACGVGGVGWDGVVALDGPASRHASTTGLFRHRPGAYGRERGSFASRGAPTSPRSWSKAILRGRNGTRSASTAGLWPEARS
jgi:hypothetical protein